MRCLPLVEGRRFVSNFSRIVEVNPVSQAPPGLFIVGSNTDVGKTYVACRIAESLAAAGRRVGVYKPAASGCRPETRESSDPFLLWQAAGCPGELDHVCPQQFTAPLAPHLAAAAEGKTIDVDLLRTGLDYWRQRSEVVIVEGVGGLMSPVSDDDYVADLAYEFRYPLVVVVANEIGVVSQTLQTLITAATFREGLDIAGVVLSRPKQITEAEDISLQTNRSELERHCLPPILGELTWNAGRFDPPVDWFSLAKRPKP
jgi:dethiobiotin synthetase